MSSRNCEAVDQPHSPRRVVETAEASAQAMALDALPALGHDAGREFRDDSLVALPLGTVPQSLNHFGRQTLQGTEVWPTVDTELATWGYRDANLAHVAIGAADLRPARLGGSRRCGPARRPRSQQGLPDHPHLQLYARRRLSRLPVVLQLPRLPLRALRRAAWMPAAASARNCAAPGADVLGLA